MINYIFRESKNKEKIEQLYKVLSHKTHKAFNPQAFNKLLDYISFTVQYNIYSVNAEEFKEQVYNGYTLENTDKVFCIHRRVAYRVYGNSVIGYRQKDKITTETLVNSSEDNIVILCDNNRGYTKSSRKAFYNRTYSIILLMGGDTNETV